MDNPEKPTTLGTQNTRRRTKQIERKKNTTEYVLDNTIGKQTEIT
jgi:hypothetical protein